MNGRGPLTGYLPRGFGLWTIPKGFFLIIRHAPGLADIAEAFVIALAARVAEVPGLAAFNAGHIAACEAHAGPLDTPVHHGIPCTITEYPDAQVPFTLITEYPDETIYGDAFLLAHTVQMATVLAAAELFTASGGLVSKPYSAAGVSTRIACRTAGSGAQSSSRSSITASSGASMTETCGQLLAQTIRDGAASTAALASAPTSA